MKKALFVVLSVFVVLISLSSCKEPEKTAGTPKLSGIEFSKYDAFAVMREPDGSRGLFDGVSGGINRLFGLTDDVLEKIIITDNKGLEWACNRVNKLSKDLFLMELSCAAYAGAEYKNYIVDRVHDKVVDLSFLMDGIHPYIKDYGVQATASGLFAKRRGAVVSIDVELKTMTQLTNPKIDIVDAFWKNDAGDMLALTDDTVKLFPKDNGLPGVVVPAGYYCNTYLKYYGLRDRQPLSFIASPSTGLIVCLETNDVYRLSSGGLSHTALSEELGGSLSYGGSYGIYLTAIPETGYADKAVWYSKRGYVTIHDVSSGEIVFHKYDAPNGLSQASYWNGHLVYLTSSGLYCLDLEKQTTETLVEGSIAKWQMTTGGVIYTKYLSATDTQTCFYNLATKETEKLSSSGVEVVSIASFVE